MDEMLDRTLLDADYKRACYRMAEAMLEISEPSWRLLHQENKERYLNRLVLFYIEREDYEPRHAKG